MGYTVDGDDGASDYGFYLNSSAQINNTIVNCTITDFNTGISTSQSGNHTFSNNNITSSASGIHLSYSHRNALSNINVYSNTVGIYIDRSANNTLTDFVSKYNANGLWIDSNSIGNNYTRGGFFGNSVNDYSYVGSSVADGNRFLSTNFTGDRIINILLNGNVFVYNDNETGNIWQKTQSTNNVVNVTRRVFNWSQTLMLWNDTSLGNVLTYNITGLNASTIYNVTNTSGGLITSRNITTDASGVLPSFSINVSSNSEISVNNTNSIADLSDKTPPTWSNQSQNASIIKNGYEVLSAYLSDENALDYSWLSTNETQSWFNSTIFHSAYNSSLNYSVVIGNDTFYDVGIYNKNLTDIILQTSWVNACGKQTMSIYNFNTLSFCNIVSDASSCGCMGAAVNGGNNYSVASTCGDISNFINSTGSIRVNSHTGENECYGIKSLPVYVEHHPTNAWSNFTWQNSSITNARVGWKIYFNDTSGNINSTDIMSFIVDSVNPSLTLALPQNTTYNSLNMSLNYTASDTNLNETWYFYNGTNTTITGNTTFIALNNQQSNLTLYVNDSAGNINSTSVTFSVDSIAPTYSNLSLNNTAPKVNETLKFSALWNDSFSSLSQYIFSWNGTSVTRTITLNETNLGIIADSKVMQNNPTTNYGNASYTTVQSYNNSGTLSNQRIYLLVNHDLLPSGAEVTDAELKLFSTSGSSAIGNNFSIYNTTTDWNETNITWNTQPTIDTLQDTINYSAVGLVTFNVTDSVASGTSNLSYVLKWDIENVSSPLITASFASNNYTTNISRRPQLVITYTVRGWANDTAVSLINWSNITKTVSDAKNTRIDYKIYANDFLGNMNVTAQGNFTVANTPPVVTASIIPSPTDGSEPLNCTYSYVDANNDLENETFFRWYVNDVLSAFTNQNLSTGNWSNGDDIICSVRSFDSTSNSTWTNSSVLTINDAVAPSLHNDYLSASSGYTNNVMTIFANATEANYMNWLYVELQDPNQDKFNLTMTQDLHMGIEYAYSVQYTPQIAGTYYIKSFYATDGSNNLGNLTSTLTYVSSVYVAPVVNNNGGGNGGGESPLLNTTVDVYPATSEVHKYSFGIANFTVKIKNAGSQSIFIKIIPSTGKENIVDVKYKDVSMIDYVEIPSGNISEFVIIFDAEKSGTFLTEYVVKEKSGQDLITFTATLYISEGSKYLDKFRKNIQYPLILSTSASKWLDITSAGIIKSSSVDTAIPIGVFLMIFSLALFSWLLPKSLFLTKTVLKNSKHLDLITFSLAAVMTVIIFVSI